MEESQEDRYRSPQLAEGPWLIATHKNRKANKLEKQLFLINNKSYMKTIPELDGNVIESAHQGWLILRSRVKRSFYSLWNPVTSQLIRLPELLAPELEEDYIEPSACVLTCSPDDVNSVETCVLVLFFDGGLVFSCRPTLVSCSWVKQSIELEGQGADIGMAVVIEGVIYAYTKHFEGHRNMFLRMTVAKDCSNLIAFEPMTLERPASKLKHHILVHEDFMVESCGVLYFIFLMKRVDEHTREMAISKVFIWRLDFSKMEWVGVDSLRNRAFLLGTRCNTWCWADAGVLIEDNSVYLAMGDDLKMYTYNLKDDSYSILLPHPNFINPFYGPTWFVPPDHPRLSHEWEEHQVINDRTKHDEKINQEFQELPTQTLLPELPADILPSLSKHMNMFDYMNLRATCKQIQKACSLAQWLANCCYPLFMVLKDRSGTYELIDPSENISHTISNVHYSPTVMSNIEFCKDGWLLVRYNGDCLKYLNPFTRETCEYPICEFIWNSAGLGFSTCPTSPDCLTVGIFGYGGVITIYCFRASNKEWEIYETEYNPDTDIAFTPNFRISSKYHKNAFYFLGVNGCLAVLQINQGGISWHVYQHPFSEETVLNSCYLAELDGELISVFIGEIGKWVRLFKFDISHKYWLELHTLEDHILFISPASCFSVLAKKREMKNKIYLPKRIGNEIVFYSLDTRKYHTSTSVDSIEDFYGMKENINCCWI